MREYHLHKDDYSQLQLEINDSEPYCERNVQHCFKPHRHSFFQLIWFKSAGNHYVDYEEFQHPANAVFFLSPSQVHAFCPESANRGYLFHFNALFLNQHEKDSLNQIKYRLFNEMGEPFVALPDESISDVQYVTDQLIAEIKAEDYNFKQQAYNYIQVLLLRIERLKQKENVNFQPDPHFDLATHFKEIVEENKHCFRSVAFFSQALGVSEKTLSTITKKYFKDTPANFIHGKRVLEAKRLLSNSKLTIKEVAYQLGFDQPTYFTKYFKKYTSVTPKQFQKEIR